MTGCYYLQNQLIVLLNDHFNDIDLESLIKLNHNDLRNRG